MLPVHFRILVSGLCLSALIFTSAVFVNAEDAVEFLIRPVSQVEDLDSVKAFGGVNSEVEDQGSSLEDDPLAALGEGEDDLDALLALELDDLGKVEAVAESFDVEVTSVTKGKSTIGKSPAAIFVINQDMIRRSGATTIPDLLRMVPGMQVARNNASKFAVSARGGNGVFANDLLVLIDGRSIYTQLFGGVYWEVEDLVLQDIQRIEIIRGPGATVWGANAVNGVINIITKSAKDTQGTLVTAGGGDQDKAITQFRHGTELGDDLYFRVWGKYRDHRDGQGIANDDWRFGRVGLRADWTPGTGPDTFTLLGQLYNGQQGTNAINEPIAAFPFLQNRIGEEESSGAHLLGRWTHLIDDVDSWTLQFYYDRVKRNDIADKFSLDIFDVDFQHRMAIDECQRITWGIGYRHYGDSVTTTNPSFINVLDTTREIERVGAFIQDEIELSDRFNLIVGSKFSYNDLSGYEYQPGVRLNFSPDETHSLWGAVSRAVRTPTRVEDDIFLSQLTAPGPVFGVITGNNRLQAEDLTAFEIGYRVQESETLAWDAALFWNRYEDQIGIIPAGAPAGVPPSFPLLFVNGAQGDAYGFELNGTWQAADNWRLRGWYSLLKLDNAGDGSSPQNTAYLMSSYDINDVMEFDVIGRYVDSLPAQGVDSYITMDVRLGFSASEDLYFSIVGQNLLDSAHREFNEVNALAVSSEVRRGVYAQVEWTR